MDAGPMLKRVRPATFGRAFQILKRSCHITVELESRPDAGPRLSRTKRRAQAAREARKQASLAAADKKAGAKDTEVNDVPERKAAKKKVKASAKSAKPAKKKATKSAKGKSAEARPKADKED